MFTIALNTEFCRSADKSFEQGVEIAAVPRQTRAIVLADALGARWVNTDEMLKPDWLDDTFAHEVMRYTPTRADQLVRASS